MLALVEDFASVDGFAQPRERATVDHGAHERRQVGRVALVDLAHHRDRPVAHLGPERVGDVRARGRRALLSLVLEGAAHERRRDGLRVGGGVHDDEVLAARLTDEPRIGAIAVDALADLAEERAEDRARAGEVHAGELGVIEADLGDRAGVARDEIDHAVRQPGLAQDLEDQPVGEDRGLRRLPDDGVAHQRRRRRQVAADGREVERRDGVDEALEAALLHAIVDARRRDRLLLCDLLGEVDVEAPEVGQLRGRVDLGLAHGLALAEHRRRVDPLPPGARRAGRPRAREWRSGPPATRRSSRDEPPVRRRSPGPPRPAPRRSRWRRHARAGAARAAGAPRSSCAPVRR